MDAKGVMRKMAWGVIAGLACLAVACVAFVAINWNDEPPSADAERLTALTRDRPALADAANGYIHALGLAAAPDVDPVAMGSARKAYIESFAAARDGTGVHGLPGEDVDYRVARAPDVAALAGAFAKTPSCGDAPVAHPQVVADWLASEQWLLERYRRMLATDGWLEPVPRHVGSPLVGHGHLLEAQALYLIAAMQQAIAGDPAAVRDLLERELVFWRQVLASSDLLISKMVAVAAVNRHFAFGTRVLQELPPDLAGAAVPPSWRQPLTVVERSLMRSLSGEWHFTGEALRTAMEPQADPSTGWSVAGHLQRPMLQRQATLNLSAARMVRLGTLSELPYAEIGPALKSMAQPPEEAPLRLRLYNLLGNMLDSAATASTYGDYIARSADLEGHRRAALLIASLRGAGTGPQDMAAAVRAAPLRNPYDDAAFEWDAAGGFLVFQGLAQGHRGRHALPSRQREATSPARPGTTACSASRTCANRSPKRDCRASSRFT